MVGYNTFTQSPACKPARSIFQALTPMVACDGDGGEWWRRGREEDVNGGFGKKLCKPTSETALRSLKWRIDDLKSQPPDER